MEVILFVCSSCGYVQVQCMYSLMFSFSITLTHRLPGDETLSNIQYDANDSEKFLDVFTTPAGAVAEDGETGEKKKYRVPLPKQVTGINGQQQYIVFNKNSMSCNSQQLDSCINLVINVPYTKA